MIASEGHYEVKLGKLPTLTDTPTHYCPGCERGTLTRLIASALDKLDARERTVVVDSVGCSVLAHEYLNVGQLQAPHGRAPAIMAGIKRMRPDLLVFAVQGNGDAVSIGLADPVRGEPRRGDHHLPGRQEGLGGQVACGPAHSQQGSSPRR